MFTCFFRSGISQPEITSYGQYSNGLLLSYGCGYHGFRSLHDSRLEDNAQGTLLTWVTNTWIRMVSKYILYTYVILFLYVCMK